MKALAVFSGGLDSMMAAKLIRAQDIEVLALFFETPFFSSNQARRSAEVIDLPIRVCDITRSHLEMVKNPPHGYGGNMNPCIDCHAMMFREAGQMLKEERADFIITGEVLGQRPMSQNKNALSVVEKESGLKGLILRPLSALCLPPTIPEERGWVDRGALLGISGRSRKPQMALAEKFNIKEYPSPAGGCLLTDQVFSRRLKDLLSSRPDVEVREIELLKLGRHFRLAPQLKLIVGRNQEENEVIRSLAGDKDRLLSTVNVPGPTTLLMGDPSPEMERFAASITVSYSDAKDQGPTEIRLSEGKNERDIKAEGQDKEGFRKYMI
ncbi:MAG: tRNA 4-thiouridine(8) synthase ThiI [Pseudomonadota bacterium]